ncbi:putative extracellular protein [Aspergillus tanneri]|nr:uncharacterized protein ATNIH1004_000226 [Aspergillus tanneri]KAA8651344.1 hypothetical protein ATNIH1004_000226 [Aspergillus tanneri]
MSNPYPIRSPLNKGATGQVDYSYTNPLSSSGSDYPCKGYAKDEFHSVADYSPGQSYPLELQGSAVHGGGSCQISLSYDKGESFRVIHSILGGCPIPKQYTFTIPSDAPSGEALLAWSWFNKIGNREMYMNCAQVTIKGSARRRPKHPRPHHFHGTEAAFDSLPTLFRANTGGPGQCTTIEGEEVNFPMPGTSVEGSLSGKGYNCQGTAPFLREGHLNDIDMWTGNASSGVGHDVSSSAEVSPSSIRGSHVAMSTAARPSSSKIASSSKVASSSRVASSFGTPSPSRAYKAQTPASDLATPRQQDTVEQTPNVQACEHGAIVCASDGKTWSLCDNGRVVHMGEVATGTECLHGFMQRVYGTA